MAMRMILVAGTDELTRGFVCRVSRYKVPGIEVISTDSGWDVLDLVLRAQPSVAIIDEDTRQISGLEVIRRARSRGTKTPLVLVASAASREMAIRARRLGAQDLLEKPLSLSRIEAVLRQFVMLRPSRQRRERGRTRGGAER